MDVYYRGIKTTIWWLFPLCFEHELLMSLRSIGNSIVLSAIWE